MAVRRRIRRTAPAPADDGRWGVARLVAQREAARLDPECRAPVRPAPELPSPRRPRAPGPRAPEGSADGPVYRPPAVSARPRVEPDPGLVGFSRLTRGRTGARAFTLCFVVIYLVIVVQTLSTIV